MSIIYIYLIRLIEECDMIEVIL